MRLVKGWLLVAACTRYTEPGLGELASREGAGQTVTIRRDAAGVPHVSASTDEAAFYGIGWAMAEDRLFQMHVSVFAVQGRLAEHFADLDPSALDRDIRKRQEGWWRAAQHKAQLLDPETAALLQAYSDGVNAWVDAHDLGLLFTGSGVQPEIWTPAHCIAAWHQLGGNFSIGVDREDDDRVLFDNDVRQLGLERALGVWLDILLPSQPSHGVVQEDDVSADYLAAVNRYAASLGYGDDPALMAILPVEGPHFSHAYAVSGWRTESGRALMVGDPQLPVLLPSVWYEYAVSSPSFRVRGVSTPGTPGLAVGFSEAAAWSLTAGGGDQADLMRLDTSPGPDRYLVDHVAYDMFVETEQALVKNGPPVDVIYRESLWGPVVAGVDGDYALHAVMLSGDDRDTVTGMLGMMSAPDLDSFVAALDDWRTPSVNLVAAGSDGRAYYSLIGAVPVRAHNAPLSGWVAQDGDTLESEWLDLIPHEFLPQVIDPPSGVAYNANHRPAGDWYPLSLGLPEASGGHTLRSARLRDLLETDEVFTRDSLISEVQLDCTAAVQRDLLTLGNHLLVVAPEVLTRASATYLAETAPWLEHATMTLGHAEVWPVSKLDLSFRESTAGALTDVHGRGVSGVVAFNDEMRAGLAADPAFVPNADALAYLNTIFAAAGREAHVVRPEEWVQAWEDSAQVAMRYQQTFPGVTPVAEWTVTSEPLTCAWSGTIWSQTGQSYTQVVELGGLAGTVKPPGSSEQREDPELLSELDHWYDGTLKPAPLDDAGIAAITVSEEVVTISGL